MTVRPGRRVVVIGTSGAGKTTMGGRLSAILDIPHVELDGLYWGPNWQPRGPDEFRRRVSEALAGDSWVVDGNYGSVRELVWGRADTLVWLDYPLPLVLSRVVRRTVKRVTMREELWNGNRERLWEQFTSDSLWLWVLTTHRRRRRQYREIPTRTEFAHLLVLRFPMPRDARAWLRALQDERCKESAVTMGKGGYP